MKASKRVPVAWIIIKGQVRKVFREDDLRRLGESMLSEGQIQPVGCLADGTLLYGERRVRAAILVGMTELDAIIHESPLSEVETRILQITENVQRENLTPQELWQACVEMKRLDASMTNSMLAATLHLDPSMITRIMAPSETSPACQEAFLAGQLKLSQVYSIAKTPKERQEEMLEAALQGAKREQLEASRRRKEPDASVIRQEKAKLKLASGVCVSVAGTKLSLEDVADALAQALDGVKKAIKSSFTIKTVCRVFADQAKAGK